MAKTKGSEKPAMRKLLVYGILLAAAVMVPSRTTELGKLKPVETLAIYQENGQVVVETDTGDIGRGVTVSKAIENLKETTAGIIYLDTADYLVIMQGGEPFVKYLTSNLKDSVRICRGDKGIDIGKTASYLSIHRPSVEIKDYREGVALDNLRQDHGRLLLVENKSRKYENNA